MSQMSTKENLLMLLDEARGTFVSGEEIAAKLQVSRGAIWKAVKALQTEGYEIQAVTRRGYCLAENTDVLTPLSVTRHLKGAAAKLKVEVYPELPSTNRMAKEQMMQQDIQEVVILSEHQTEGRGRKGRGFFSPPQTGLYMSVLLRPRISIQDATLLTAAAAVAVAETLEQVSGKKTQIKWVNDIFQDGKKVAGILTEAGMSIENSHVEYAILGIGVNVFTPEKGFPPELEQAGAVFSSCEQKGGIRGRIAAEIINRLVPLSQSLQDRSFLEEYRRRSMVLGQKITVLDGHETREAVALGMDDQCHLQVRYENGEEKFLSGGEISIRVKS